MNRWSPKKPCCLLQGAEKGIRDCFSLLLASQPIRGSLSCFLVCFVRLIQIRTCMWKAMCWHPVVMPERKHMCSRRRHMFSRRGRVFSRMGCDCQMLQSPYGFSSLFPGSCWARFANRDTFAPKYHHFVAPLLHSLQLFTHSLMPQHCLSLLHHPQLSDASCSKTALWGSAKEPGMILTA